MRNVNLLKIFIFNGEISWIFKRSYSSFKLIKILGDYSFWHRVFSQSDYIIIYVSEYFNKIRIFNNSEITDIFFKNIQYLIVFSLNNFKIFISFTAFERFFFTKKKPVVKMPANYVYIIKCIGVSGKISYYTGSTKNLHKRFQEHVSGKGAKYTRNKKLELVYYETLLTVSESRKRENEIKSLSIKQKKDLIKGI